MKFIRQQEERVTVQFLKWKYKRINFPIPSESELKRQASEILDEAHQIAKKRGSNVISILKDLVSKYKRPE